MPRLTKDHWRQIKAEWERTGASYRDLADKWGVSAAAIQKHSAEEEWLRDPTKEVERRTARKVAEAEASRRRAEKALEQAKVDSEVDSDPSTSPTVNLPARALSEDEVVEETAEARAEVILRHQEQWREFDKLRRKAMALVDNPDIRMRRTIYPDGKIVEEEIFDFSRIAQTKIVAETLFIEHKGERLAHNLDHNMNLTKAQDIEQRDALIKSAFSALDAIGRKVRERMEAEAKTIDVTPNGRKG